MNNNIAMPTIQRISLLKEEVERALEKGRGNAI